MRLYVIGATGGVGQEVLKQAALRGHRCTAQTRNAAKLRIDGNVSAAVGEPTDEAFLTRTLPGHDAVVFVLGIDRIGPTTLFSDAGRALIRAMTSAGVSRLVAVTGVGAGDTRGHGGWLYDWIIFPLFTRHRYAEKEAQERLIERSALDWTIVRPAPYKEGAASEPLQVFTAIPPGTQLTRVTRAEVAAFILDELQTNRYLREKPFVGHRR